ncbi:Ribonuclease H1 [Batrachochytrium dendrobatidis]|nr:Ribonuclease H1 [Batrachochytrium dendrobatidis]
MDIHTELVISPHFDARQGIDKTVAHRLVYTDGSCLNNGRPDATGGIGIWFGTESAYNGGMVYPFPSPTNNACELFAVCMALAVVQEQSQLGTMELFEKLYVFTGLGMSGNDSKSSSTSGY